MTTETQDWTTMPAGREMDALVAERVMGMQRYGAVRYGKPCVVLVRKHSDCWNYTRTQSDPGTWERTTDPVTEGGRIPRYSTDIGDAWPIVEVMEKRGCSVVYRTSGPRDIRRVEITVPAPDNKGPAALFAADADTAPLAICRAALAARAP